MVDRLLKPVDESHPPEQNFNSQVLEATVSELLGDIKNLDNELRNVADKIEALAPSVDDVDRRWLAGRSRALSNEFEAVVTNVLSQKAKAALDSYSIDFRKARDVLTTQSQENARNATVYFIGCISVSFISGIAGACIAAYFITGGTT